MNLKKWTGREETSREGGRKASMTNTPEPIQGQGDRGSSVSPAKKSSRQGWASSCRLVNKEMTGNFLQQERPLIQRPFIHCRGGDHQGRAGRSCRRMRIGDHGNAGEKGPTDHSCTPTWVMESCSNCPRSTPPPK